MKRGYHSKKELAAVGWAPVVQFGRDIPLHAEVVEAAATAGVSDVSAWRMSDGNWHLCTRHGTKNNQHGETCHAAVRAAGLASEHAPARPGKGGKRAKAR